MHAERFVAFTLMILIAQNTNRSKEAYICYEQALNKCNPSDIRQKLLLSIILSNAATMHFEAGHYDTATSEFSKILAFREAF
jgi:hypothetical protein